MQLTSLSRIVMCCVRHQRLDIGCLRNYLWVSINIFFVKLTSIKLSSTNATLVCVLSDIKSAVIFCICPVTDISAEVPPFGVKVCVTIDLSSGQKVSPIGDDIFRGHQMGDRKGRGGQCLGL